MALITGSRLGSYEILGPIGAGGMGEVYRGRDPRLDREVAIKVLPPSLSSDPAALARFEREAMSVAKLSHPNILSIFEFARTDGTSFVVMELVDGVTLRTMISSGALPVRRAVAYAIQLARGMAAAHARGIVHRDLKPENVMITRQDQVKILDFGLAKPLDMPDADVTQGPGLTTAGVILGTVGYMAPEQVRGAGVDHRADVFAFGAVLYEMLTGVRAFQADTAADTLTAVLTKEPAEIDPSQIALAPGLDRIVRRCLEKIPDLRFQSASDLAFALEALSSGARPATATADAAAPGRRVPGWVPWAVAAAAAIAALAAWIPKTASPPVPRWTSFTRISEAAGDEIAPSLSPDGGTVAYAARVNGSWGIYAQRVGGRNATLIVDDPERDEGGPVYSPDGASIAFHESDEAGGVFVAGATGESVRRLTDLGFDASWSPDGRQVAFTTEEAVNPASRLGLSALHIADVGGGPPRVLVEADAMQASWSPSGQHLVYWSTTGGQRDLYTVAAAGGAPVPVTQDLAIDWSPVWSPDGDFIYFSSDRGGAMNLWRIAVDAASGHSRGEPEPVTLGVQASSSRPHFSKDGARLAFASSIGSISPVAIPFDPATLRAGVPAVLATQNNIRVPSDVSAKGDVVAYFSIGDRQEDIFVGPPGGPMRRVTDDAARDRAPVFTADGRSLVFYSSREGNWAAWTIGVDGGGLRKITGPDSGVMYPQISPSGDRIVFAGISAALGLFSAPLTPGAVPTALPGTTIDGQSFSQTAWSPDGARLAGSLRLESGHPAGVAVYDLSAGMTSLVSPDPTFGVRWLPDSRRVVYFTKNGWQLVVLDTVSRERTVVEVSLPGRSTAEVFAISADGRTIYYGAERSEVDIWIAEQP